MRAVELFTGAGGLGIGISRAGFEPILVVERDRWCCDTLRQNRALADSPIRIWPAPCERDVRSVDFRELENAVDLVAGGPPCQPFSMGGRHKAHEDHRDMWSEAVRAVRETRPRAFIFENVKGLKRRTFASYLEYILLQLHYPAQSRHCDEAWTSHLARLQSHKAGGCDAEYSVVHQLLNTADFGVPQKRERVVFVGYRSDIDATWRFPSATHSRTALLDDQSVGGSYWDRNEVARRDRSLGARVAERKTQLSRRAADKPWVTVREALAGLPDPEREPGRAIQFLNHRFQPGARSYPGHTGSPLDEPAKTLKAGVHGVPGGENMMRRADGSVRYFTVRESARLQTFPDEYALHGAWSEAMRQLGNAVPVTLGEIIATSVRGHLQRCAPR